MLHDLGELHNHEGARGLLYRSSIELTRAIDPARFQALLSQPPSNPPPDRRSTHAFDVAFHDFLNPTATELDRNRALVSGFDKRCATVRSATWFVPSFNHALYGGIYTIFRFMDWMATNHDVEHRVVLFDNPYVTDEALRASMTAAFPSLSAVDIVIPTADRAPFMDSSELPYTDIAICTIWYSAYSLLRFNRTLAKFYFVQDFEPLFYPGGTLSALSEATYRFGFAGLVNTPGLEQSYGSYGNPSRSFVPAVDSVSDHVVKPSTVEGNPVQVVIYGRPGTDRNAFELLAATCARLKARFGDAVRIVSAGETWDPSEFRLDGIVENVGLLESRDEIDQLYRRSDIGVVCMLSRHPSYQPFEYWAAGAAVVTNTNSSTRWLLRNRENCLAVEPFPIAMADAIGELVENPTLRRRLARRGAEDIRRVSWESEFGGLWDFISGRDDHHG